MYSVLHTTVLFYYFQIYGSRDIDGFYRGELNGRRGLVPSNMVAPIDKEAAYRMADLSISGPTYPPGRIPPRGLEYEPYYSQRPLGALGGLSRRRLGTYCTFSIVCLLIFSVAAGALYRYKKGLNLFR